MLPSQEWIIEQMERLLSQGTRKDAIHLNQQTETNSLYRDEPEWTSQRLFNNKNNFNNFYRFRKKIKYF